MRHVWVDNANTAQKKQTVKAWMPTTGKRTALKPVVTVESVSVDTVPARRGITQMKFISPDAECAIIWILIIQWLPLWRQLVCAVIGRVNVIPTILQCVWLFSAHYFMHSCVWADLQWLGISVMSVHKIQGQTCKMCQNCLGICAKHKERVQCRVFNNGGKRDRHAQECFHYHFTKVECWDKFPQPIQVDPLLHCEKYMEDCWFYFTQSVTGNNQAFVHTGKTPGCPTGPEVTAIIDDVVAGIVLIGLALLLI